MNRLQHFLVIIFVLLAANNVNAQFSKSVDDFEIQHKECLHIKPDSSGCSRVYLAQLDSILPVVLEALKVQLFSDEKTALIQEQLELGKKESRFL
jgi:hypothetical protein